VGAGHTQEREARASGYHISQLGQTGADHE